ncbi:MAG: pyridoxamine 5'-phosphate oxidase family protein [Phycisphaerales bacterium]|jgi:pyridoxamine 5'-phosphate oxidase
MNLADILDSCWHGLEIATRDRRHAWRLPVLASAGADGWPASRTVVLRQVDRSAPLIACHTDARSPKLAEIAADPRVSWTFYDPQAQVQLRVQARATVHRAAEADPIALERWERTSLSSRRCYLAPSTPGAACESPSANLPEGLLDRSPVPGEDLPGLANFAVIATRPRSFDWLLLRASGHRRARFMLEGEGAPHATWAEP